MDEPKLSRPSRKALEVFREQTGAPLDPATRDALWRSAVAAAEPSRNRWVLKGFALCAACAVIAVLVIPMLRAQPAEVQAPQTAQWRREGDVVTVARGEIRLEPRRKISVVTPHLRLMAQNAIVLCSVSETATILKCESGEVAWQTASGSGVLRAGEQKTFRALAAAPTLKVAAGVPVVNGCALGAGHEKCLVRQAEGSGLEAQTALYALGMLAHERGQWGEAVKLLRGYGQRFPDGVFGPEASIAVMVDLKEEGRIEEARAEAAAFSTRFADEPRAADVARWGEQIP